MNGNLVWWHNEFRTREAAAALGFRDETMPSLIPAAGTIFTGGGGKMGGFTGLPGLGDIISGGIADVIGWGVGQLPARRPPTLPPARVPPTLPPAGVPYPGGVGIPRGGGVRGGRGLKAAVLAAGGYVIGRFLYDAAGNLVGTAPSKRMNVCNPRALRRAMRRVEGFARVAKRTISFTKRVKMKKRSKGKCR